MNNAVLLIILAITPQMADMQGGNYNEITKTDQNTEGNSGITLKLLIRSSGVSNLGQGCF